MSDLFSTRRSFLRTASAFATVLAWHPASDAVGAPPAASNNKVHGSPRFRHLQLQAKNLEELRTFYTKTLGVPLRADTENSFTLAFGQTLIEFQRAPGEQDPFYHFAFNIPENKFRQAKDWLRSRCPLLKDNLSGADELYFRNWNSHATYFQDPSGNIAELIARHTLPNASDGEFGAHDILYVSEIGLVAAEPDQLVTGIDHAFGLKPYLGDKFFVGDEYGLFVLPRVGRPWIPERRQQAGVFPARVTMTGDGKKEFNAPGLPYCVRREA
jgi:catechol 2,3-dioxygenase-like lactoylglutathione lyase family enzyme